MLAQRAPQPRIFVTGNFFDAYKFAVQHVFRFGAKNVCQTSGHARSEIQTERTEHQYHASGHVFAAVLAHAFDHGQCAAVANCKALTGTASDEKLSGSCAVQNSVSGKHIAAPRCAGTRGDGDGPAGQTFSDVVVGFTFQPEINSNAEKCAETLSGAAVKFLGDEFSGRAPRSSVARHFSAQASANAAVGIANHGNSRVGLKFFLDGGGFAERCVNPGNLLRSDAEGHI